MQVTEARGVVFGGQERGGLFPQLSDLFYSP